ncbi:MAG TPA: right-handed parallel beta-helix repeat-containing protein [Candidatus Acidoferrum sp.]|nr:right-handed parallel beta-helix repeat-containing protein [Candidatus Acidoferrum sp.]
MFVFMMLVFLSQGASQSTRNLNPIRDSLIRQDLLPTSSEGKDRYVSLSGSDYNDGTQQHPWATVSHAGSVASPGTIVHVAPGVYGEAVVTGASGTLTARIIYISDQAWGAVIDAPGRDGFAWRNTGSYTDIIGFEIAGSRCGGIGLGASFQRAMSNHVHNSAAGCTASSGSGINDFNYETQGNDILNNYIHDVGISEPSCGQFRHNYIQGIYQANAGGHIDHNISVNNCGWGIHLWHAATHATIINNTVVGNKAGGIVIGSGDAPCSTTGCPGGNDFTIVQNNIVAFNGNVVSGGWGLGEASQLPGKTGTHNEYSYNLSFQNVSGDFLLPQTLPCRDCIVGKDPRFVSMSSGDYRLAADSPAISAGRILKPAGAYQATPKSLDIGALPSGRILKQQ